MKSNRTNLNMIFPVFMLIVFHPLMWVASILWHLLIGTLIILTFSKIAYKKFDFDFYKKTIFKSGAFGLLMDFVGGVTLTGIFFYFGLLYRSVTYDIDNQYLSDNAFKSHLGASYPFLTNIGLHICIIIFLVAVFTWLLNYFVTFRKCDMSKKQKAILSVLIAVLGAPYMYFIV